MQAHSLSGGLTLGEETITLQPSTI
jgi:hypothetical protein